MLSRLLKITLALSSVLGLFAALVAVKSRLSWLPVSSVVGSTLSEPRHSPLAWHGNELWLLSGLGNSSLAYGDTGLFSFTDGSRTKIVRNWNRSPIRLLFGGTKLAQTATLHSAQNKIARVGYGSANIGVFRQDKLLLSIRERGYRNRYNLMQPGYSRLLSYSPDGTRLVADSRLAGYSDYEEVKRGFCIFGLVLFDAQTGKQIARQSAIEGCFADFAWSPDSREVAGITEDGWIFILNAQNGKTRLKFRGHQPFGAQIAWSPDGKTLVSATNPRIGWSPTRLSFDFKTGTSIETSGFQGENLSDNGKRKLKTNSNGDTLMNGRSERLLKRFDTTTGKPIGSPLPLETGAVDLAFSPDGQQLAVGEHGFALVLDASTLATQQRLDTPKTFQARYSYTSPVCVAWAPDNATLATSVDSGITFWRTR